MDESTLIRPSRCARTEEATDGLTPVQGQNRPSFSRIAVGVDHNPEATDAVVLGAAIARITGAELVLVAVAPSPRFSLPREEDDASLTRPAMARVQEVRDSLAPDARTVVESDVSVPRGLQRVIQREHCDLLVVGSSRHAPEGRVRIGGRTRQLLSSVDCSLAIAPRGMQTSPRRGLNRIGVGYDGSAEAEVALALASALALAGAAELQLCAVVDDRVPPIGWSTLAVGGAGVPHSEEVVLVELDRLRELTQSRADAIGPGARAEVRRGRPADVLRKLAEGIELLVIGSRHWGAAARLLLGSTGESLAHDAGCPLLVVPRPSS